jgi:hypothetical protein
MLRCKCGQKMTEDNVTRYTTKLITIGSQQAPVRMKKYECKAGHEITLPEVVRGEERQVQDNTDR